MPESSDQDTNIQQEDTALFAGVVDLLRRYRAASDPDRFAGDLDLSRQQLESFLAANPDSVPALRLLAEVSQRLGDLVRTREYIEKAELLDPWNLEILIISESLYNLEARESPRGPGQTPVLDSELSSGAISTEKIVEKAMGSFRLGQLQRAYTLSKLAFRIEPAKGHHLLDVWAVGAALDPERTRKELADLMQEESAQPYLYLALGSIDNVLGLYDEAVGWLQRGLSLRPDDPFVHAMLFNELAYVLIRLNVRLDAAVRYARDALALFPDRNANGFIRDTLGLAYLKLSDNDKALRNLREAVAKDAAVASRFHLAVALLRDHDTADALDELRQIASARPSLESPHVEEAAILQRVQSHIGRLEDLLNLGGADDIRDALSILEGLV